ncbi:MAG TPA: RNA polymerase sigma factor [Taishania sp.]|nr:RNA polymerase sigma factor [Taishania sp.]
MKHSDNDILQLARQSASSYNEAFTLIVKQFGPRLFPQINRITKNRQWTEDCLQNVFIKVFQNLKDFRGESSIYSWLYRIANNEALNYIQKEKIRWTSDLGETSIEIIAQDFGFNHVSTEVIEKHLLDAIATLPQKQAEVFELKFFQDLKFSEIAEITGVSEGGLKANYHHAAKKIEEYLRSCIH